jgi:hypothetical protein
LEIGDEKNFGGTECSFSLDHYAVIQFGPFQTAGENGGRILNEEAEEVLLQPFWKK